MNNFSIGSALFKLFSDGMIYNATRPAAKKIKEDPEFRKFAVKTLKTSVLVGSVLSMVAPKLTILAGIPIVYFSEKHHRKEYEKKQKEQNANKKC